MALARIRCSWLIISMATTLTLLASVARGTDVFFEWNISITMDIRPINDSLQIIAINGMFPGPLINATTDDMVHVNIFNNLDEPLLMTWNGIQQRLNSWQDGVSGTNCPIQPGKNWTYVFQMKDQIGSFFYSLSTNFQKSAGGFGPIRINNRDVIKVPFPKPDGEFDLLIGDWSYLNYTEIRDNLGNKSVFQYLTAPILMNGKANYDYTQDNSYGYELFNVTRANMKLKDILIYLESSLLVGKTYRFRISNVGSALSFNFRIRSHEMVLVETEGSYTNQITLDSLDVHVGQSYSVLVTADKPEDDYCFIASPTQSKSSTFGLGVLHYTNSHTPAVPIVPDGPDPMDRNFSIMQAKSIRWNMTAGAARPNPQGTFNVTNVTLSQTFILYGLTAEIDGVHRYTVNNVSYRTPKTPLKLADYLVNGSGVYQLDTFPVRSINPVSVDGTSVVTGIHKGWIELVFRNILSEMDSWHLDGFGFFVVGFGDGVWTPASRASYNLFDPVVRSTVQVYPKGWTAVYAYLDNPGMWNLRSQRLENWYLGQEIYIRVYDSDNNTAKERPPPDNLLFCGIFAPLAPQPVPHPVPRPAPHPAPQGVPETVRLPMFSP
ncbi:hypothetical protein GIB67_018082 [Kingdonia uniflora]|uniref:Monocopper oxidase-like protein SKU5 n=1 Tax=Kingdonia uniflora TaxID=39325 RepID=A0A7J7NXB9_9MAGN|nr:hypothetical protein GIB67_018082 [Kingdonia uniflora]